MRVLALESSCDESAGRPLLDGARARAARATSSFSQVGAAIAPTGGVGAPSWPRATTTFRRLLPLVARAALGAGRGASPATIHGVAYTAGPGLIGALLNRGLAGAQSLPTRGGVPAIGVHHLEGTSAGAAAGSGSAPRSRIWRLLVSGRAYAADRGVRGGTLPRWLGTSRDDAAGEAFDKTAKLLGFAVSRRAATSRSWPSAVRPAPSASRGPCSTGRGSSSAFSGPEDRRCCMRVRGRSLTETQRADVACGRAGGDRRDAHPPKGAAGTLSTPGPHGAGGVPAA